MKKFLKLIIIYLVSIILFLFIAEFSVCLKDYYSYRNFNVPPDERSNYSLIEHIKYKYKYKHNTYINENEFRKPLIKNLDKALKENSSIVLIGCSYTYGINLNDNETLSYQLSNKVGKTVYNLGLPGGGPREILYILRDKNLVKKITQNDNIEYVIYTYIGDHQRRIYTNLRPLVPKFKITNKSNLKQVKENKLIRKSQSINKLKELWYDNFLRKDKKSFNTFVIYMKEINKEIKKTFSNNGNTTKLVILVYAPWNNEDWELLKYEDIIIIKVSDLIGQYIDKNPEFRTFDDHPNAKAWEVIVPALAKELNI